MPAVAYITRGYRAASATAVAAVYSAGSQEIASSQPTTLSPTVPVKCRPFQRISILVVQIWA